MTSSNSKNHEKEKHNADADFTPSFVETDSCTSAQFCNSEDDLFLDLPNFDVDVCVIDSNEKSNLVYHESCVSVDTDSYDQKFDHGQISDWADISQENENSNENYIQYKNSILQAANDSFYKVTGKGDRKIDKQVTKVEVDNNNVLVNNSKHQKDIKTIEKDEEMECNDLSFMQTVQYDGLKNNLINVQDETEENELIDIKNTNVNDSSNVSEFINEIIVNDQDAALNNPVGRIDHVENKESFENMNFKKGLHDNMSDQNIEMGDTNIEADYKKQKLNVDFNNERTIDKLEIDKDYNIESGKTSIRGNEHMLIHAENIMNDIKQNFKTNDSFSDFENCLDTINYDLCNVKNNNEIKYNDNTNLYVNAKQNIIFSNDHDSNRENKLYNNDIYISNSNKNYNTSYSKEVKRNAKDVDFDEDFFATDITLDEENKRIADTAGEVSTDFSHEYMESQEKDNYYDNSYEDFFADNNFKEDKNISSCNENHKGDEYKQILNNNGTLLRNKNECDQIYVNSNTKECVTNNIKVVNDAHNECNFFLTKEKPEIKNKNFQSINTGFTTGLNKKISIKEESFIIANKINSEIENLDDDKVDSLEDGFNLMIKRRKTLDTVNVQNNTKDNAIKNNSIINNKSNENLVVNNKNQSYLHDIENKINKKTFITFDEAEHPDCGSNKVENKDSCGDKAENIVYSDDKVERFDHSDEFAKKHKTDYTKKYVNNNINATDIDNKKLGELVVNNCKNILIERDLTINGPKINFENDAGNLENNKIFLEDKNITLQSDKSILKNIKSHLENNKSIMKNNIFNIESGKNERSDVGKLTFNLTTNYKGNHSGIAVANLSNKRPMRSYLKPEIGHISTEISYIKRMEKICKEILKIFIKDDFKWFIMQFKWSWFHLFVNDKINDNDNTIIELLVEQIKKRKEKEYSIIRRIIEGDEIPNKYMVLLVIKINKERLEVFDGYYSVYVKIDNDLKKTLISQKIRPGSYLHVFGAKLLITNKSIFEIGIEEEVFLFNYNCINVGCKKKLGYQKSKGFIKYINNIIKTGGIISGVEVEILKVIERKILIKVKTYVNTIDEKDFDKEIEKIQNLIKKTDQTEELKWEVKRIIKLLVKDKFENQCLFTWYNCDEVNTKDKFRFYMVKIGTNSVGLHLVTGFNSFAERINKLR
ncbi:Breast cancer 2 [Conglomerata obtusa]